MSDGGGGIIVLLIAAAAAIGTVAAWAGKWRSWARQFLFGAIGSWPITLMPAIALLCLASGLASFGVAPGLVAVLFLAGLVLFGIFLLNPRWWGPAWYRTVRADLKAGRIRPDMHDPSTALIVGAIDGTPSRSSTAVVEQEFSGAPDEAWSVTWIRGRETAAKQHALERPGAVAGTLELRPEGIVFAANAAEDRIRDTPTVLWITPDELTSASAVVPGAGADGHTTPSGGMLARLPRRVVPRLVVSTRQGAHLFETYGADEKAKRIVELYKP
jgi:hypothetical protein